MKPKIGISKQVWYVIVSPLLKTSLKILLVISMHQACHPWDQKLGSTRLHSRLKEGSRRYPLSSGLINGWTSPEVWLHYHWITQLTAIGAREHYLVEKRDYDDEVFGYVAVNELHLVSDSLHSSSYRGRTPTQHIRKKKPRSWGHRQNWVWSISVHPSLNLRSSFYTHQADWGSASFRCATLKRKTELLRMLLRSYLIFFQLVLMRG